jgi:hypothetical protein
MNPRARIEVFHASRRHISKLHVAIRLLAYPMTSIHTAMLSSSTEASFFKMRPVIRPGIYCHLYFASWTYHDIHYFLYLVNNFATIPS